MPGGHPSLLQQDLKIGFAQRPELVDETDAGKELRVPRESLFDSGHADEHHAQAALIEDRAQLLQTVHRQTICFIDNYKGSRIRDSLEPGLVLVERVVVCWLMGQGMIGPVISVIPVLDTPSLVPTRRISSVTPCSARVARFATLQIRGDLTVLSADPASDPLAFAKVRYAIRGGKVIASAATAASGK